MGVKNNLSFAKRKKAVSFGTASDFLGCDYSG